MHPSSTRDKFLRLRLQRQSFASISRQLGVSKPTLIAWSRQLKPDILQDQQNACKEVSVLVHDELADLRRKLTGLNQELFSRSLREIPTEILETMGGKLRARIQHLESMQSLPHEIT